MKKFCINCGQEIKVKFCENCGTQAVDEPVNPNNNHHLHNQQRTQNSGNQQARPRTQNRSNQENRIRIINGSQVIRMSDSNIQINFGQPNNPGMQINFGTANQTRGQAPANGQNTSNRQQGNHHQPYMQQPGMQQPNYQQPGMQQPNHHQPGMQQSNHHQPHMQPPNYQQANTYQYNGPQPGLTPEEKRYKTSVRALKIIGIFLIIFSVYFALVMNESAKNYSIDEAINKTYETTDVEYNNKVRFDEDGNYIISNTEFTQEAVKGIMRAAQDDCITADKYKIDAQKYAIKEISNMKGNYVKNKDIMAKAIYYGTILEFSSDKVIKEIGALTVDTVTPVYLKEEEKNSDKTKKQMKEISNLIKEQNKPKNKNKTQNKSPDKK